MSTENKTKSKTLGIVGLIILAIITSTYLLLLFKIQDQIFSPFIELLIGLGIFAIALLIKFLIDIQKSNN
jgi:CHASE2 domain-containing sensor protein